MITEAPASGAATPLHSVPRSVWLLTLAVLALHLALAGRYDFFRNELYFIVCGRHPAFGYADQPPLAPLIAAATQIFGENLFLLRVPAALAYAAVLPLTAAIAGLLGAGWGAQLIAALAVVLAPGLTGMSSTFGTSSFEPLGWTFCAYLVLRAVLHGRQACWIWAGLVAGLCFEAKFGVAIWAAGLAAGVLLTPYRGQLLGRRALQGAALAAAIAAPTLIWQAAHGFPFAEIIAYHSSEGRIFTGSFGHFLHAQVLAMNILLVPLWLGGIALPFLPGRPVAARIPATAFIVTAAAIFLAHGKDYYLFPAYPAIFASGAACAASLCNVWVVGGWAALASANAAFIAPITLPLLSPPDLRAYMLRTHIIPAPSEAAGIGATITQVFSDEQGWRSLAAQVSAIYRGRSADEQRQTGIFAWNYGEAAAIDVLAPAQPGGGDGAAPPALPPAMSGEDQYFLWGPRGDVRDLILVNADAQAWQARCASLQQVARFGASFAMPYENDRPIYLCRGLTAPLASFWPSLHWTHRSGFSTEQQQ